MKMDNSLNSVGSKPTEENRSTPANGKSSAGDSAAPGVNVDLSPLSAKLQSIEFPEYAADLLVHETDRAVIGASHLLNRRCVEPEDRPHSLRWNIVMITRRDIGNRELLGVVLASGNRGKLAELQKTLDPLGIELVSQSAFEVAEVEPADPGDEIEVSVQHGVVLGAEG